MRRRQTLLLAILALLARAGYAESPWRKLYHASVAAVAAASVADMSTSLGKYETNPALRGSNGAFGARGIAIKSVVAGGALAAEFLISRRRREAAPAAAIANFGMAATWGSFAYHNMRFARIGTQ